MLMITRNKEKSYLYFEELNIIQQLFMIYVWASAKLVRFEKEIMRKGTTLLDWKGPWFLT